MSRRKGRGLKAEEQALWDKIAARTRPMDRPRALISTKSPPKAPLERTSGAQPENPRDGTRIPDGFRIGATPRAPALVTKPASTPPIMDAKTHGRMTRGKLRPEARIDLHGMTVAEAHPALIRFIEASHAKGRRLVLVITGKGRDLPDLGPIPRRPGVLRQQVPGWLMAGSLRAMVLDIAPAHQRHGGSGAYYVYLRNRR